MTDKELLELAAKAAGYKEYSYGELSGGDSCLYLHDTDFTGIWNPLTDDGDALRLAVKLGFGITKHWPVTRSTDGTDPYAATRRAIVRAAAEIGKGMK